MKCAVHPEKDATGYCRNCGRPMCPECTRDVRGALYCEPCLAGLVSSPAATVPSGTSGRNPGVALGLGFIPGLGAVYNGEYVKALIHVLIFGGLIAAQSGDVSGGVHAFLGIALGCFYLYMPIDAYHVARAQQVTGRSPAGQDMHTVLDGSNRPLGAIILIGVGILLLFANLGWLGWDWFSRLWPLGLVLIGIWLLAERLKRNA